MILPCNVPAGTADKWSCWEPYEINVPLDQCNYKQVRTSIQTSISYSMGLSWVNEIQIRWLFPFELCHGKTSLKIFVVVILKEGLAETRQSFFGYDTDCKIELFRLHRLLVYSVVGAIRKEGLGRDTRQSFFWHDTDKDLKAHFPAKQLICEHLLFSCLTHYWSSDLFKPCGSCAVVLTSQSEDHRVVLIIFLVGRFLFCALFISEKQFTVQNPLANHFLSVIYDKGFSCLLKGSPNCSQCWETHMHHLMIWKIWVLGESLGFLTTRYPKILHWKQSPQSHVQTF